MSGGSTNENCCGSSPGVSKRLAEARDSILMRYWRRPMHFSVRMPGEDSVYSVGASSVLDGGDIHSARRSAGGVTVPQSRRTPPPKTAPASRVRQAHPRVSRPPVSGDCRFAVSFLLSAGREGHLGCCCLAWGAVSHGADDEGWTSNGPVNLLVRSVTARATEARAARAQPAG